MYVDYNLIDTVLMPVVILINVSVIFFHIVIVISNEDSFECDELSDSENLID